MNEFNRIFDSISRLIEIPGVSGHEGKVADYIRSSLASDNLEFITDHLGNLIVHIVNRGKRVMLVAHMDEVGLMVQRILPDGFLKVVRIGGTSLQSLPGNYLSVWTNKGRLPAVAGVLPQHLAANAPFPDFSNVYIDIGSHSSEETRTLGVNIGDVLTWDASLQCFNKTQICGKALDDRLGCFILMELARTVKPENLNCDLYLAFTVQEESMLIAGLTAAKSISPEVIIGIDGTIPFDTPDLDGQQNEVRLGNGPAIKWMDAIRGKLAAFLPNQKLCQLTRELALANNIPLQDEVVTGMSTAITHMLYYPENGASAMGLSIPIRYHHSPVETADLNDINHTILLMQKLLSDDSFDWNMND